MLLFHVCMYVGSNIYYMYICFILFIVNMQRDTHTYICIHIHIHVHLCSVKRKQTRTQKKNPCNYSHSFLKHPNTFYCYTKVVSIKWTLWNEGWYRNGFTSFRVRDNETSSWDQHIYWVCHVSNVTKVKDLRNTLCGSLHTLWSHNSSLIQMQ